MGQKHPHVYQDPGCPTRTLCCSLDHCHFVSQWFQCCSWLMYISDWWDARHSPVSFSKSLKYLGYIPEGVLINHNLGIVQISVSMATLSPWAMNLQRCTELHGSQHLKHLYNTLPKELMTKGRWGVVWYPVSDQNRKIFNVDCRKRDIHNCKNECGVGYERTGRTDTERCS